MGFMESFFAETMGDDFSQMFCASNLRKKGVTMTKRKISEKIHGLPFSRFYLFKTSLLQVLFKKPFDLFIWQKHQTQDSK